MLSGEGYECDYCWGVEWSDRFSDRTFKSGESYLVII